MKMFKMLFVLFCLLAYTLVFTLPAKGQDFQPRRSLHPTHAAAGTTLPFKAIVEKDSPLFGDRQMTLKIGDVAAGQQVTVLDNYGATRVDRPVVLLVSHADTSGKEHTGYFYGTLRVRVPH